MIWIFVLVAAIIPSTIAGAWGEYEVVKDQKVTELVTKMCTQNGAEDKVPQVLDAIENFEKCTVSLFKDETLLEEVATSIRNDDIDGVFKAYCARVPRLAACTYSLVDNGALCASGAGSPVATAAHNYIDQLLSFVCYNEGERLAIFIQDGGPQCFQQNAGALSKCTADLISRGLDVSVSVDKRCEAYDQLSICMMTALDSCSPPTPADMAEALFVQMRHVLPCASVEQEGSPMYMGLQAP